MSKFGFTLAIAGLITASTAQAVPDTGLVLHNTGIAQGATGLGAKATVKIKLGPDSVVEKSERLKFGLTGGPVASWADPKSFDGLRRSDASLLSIEVKPGYSTSVNFGGKPVAVHYTKLGAAENDQNDDDDGKQSTGDKVAWVALVAGGVMLALVGYYVAECGSGRCSE